MTNATLGKIALTAVVVLGGGGFLVYSSVGHAQHYKMVQELVSGGLDQWKDTELKVHGFVEAGTIVEATVNQETRRSFVLTKEGKKIRVFSTGPKPDTFKDQSEVVATGRLVPAKDMQAIADQLCAKPHPGCPIHADAEQPYVVDATDLMAKCPSKYDGAPSNKIDTNFK
ncbi:MAG TPA: cytochrome c maturation protein CcmE [Kofleriaceae bacterium]|nr:cytochrome c maturation protein CcmE [Kofleriaceae bacterium]